jgi:hypothetical protein
MMVNERVNRARVADWQLRDDRIQAVRQINRRHGGSASMKSQH